MSEQYGKSICIKIIYDAELGLCNVSIVWDGGLLLLSLPTMSKAWLESVLRRRPVIEKRNDVLQYDKRVMHRYVTEGQMTQKEVEKYFAGLPDLSEECEDIADSIYGELQHIKNVQR
jgi:hypothetical protein